MRAARRLAAAVSVLAVTTVAGAVWSEGSRTSLDVTSVAIASQADPVVSDGAFDSGRLGGSDVSSNTSAGANTDCDGCASAATTLGVVYVDGVGVARLDNLATSTTSACAGCRSAALSVQVVVVRRAGTAIPNNRAVAVNAACAECRSAAVAYQFVAVSPKGGRLDRHDLAELQAWVDEQAGLLQGAPSALSLRRSAAAAPRTAGIEARLRTALGPETTVATDVDAQVR